MLVGTREQLQNLARLIQKQPFIILDVETTGLNIWQEHRIVGIGIALPDESTFYVPTRHPSNNVPIELIKTVLWPAIRKVPIIVGFNIKFDLAALYQDSLDLAPNQEIEDLIVAARLATPGQFTSLSLMNQSIHYLGKKSVQYEYVFKAWLKEHKLSKATMAKVPAKECATYCDGDVLCTLRLRSKLEEKIQATSQWSVWQQEIKVTRTLWEMEKVGVFFDKEICATKIPQLEEYIEKCKQAVYSIVGYEFNINSPPQLTLAMQKVGIAAIAWSDKTGKPSWTAKVLQELHTPMTGRILEIRGIGKLLSTYYRPAMNWDATQHPQIKNWGCITGRCSCAAPNLQNIAKSTSILAYEDDDILTILAEMYSEHEIEQNLYNGLIKLKEWDEERANDLVSVRRLYIARPGFDIYMFDYEQMEMRMFAEYTQDPAMLAMCEDPLFDFHENVAGEVWGYYKGDEWYEFYRFLAKAINFGLIYGIGTKKLGINTGKTTEQAAAYKAEYFSRFPMALEFIDAVRASAKSRGWVINKYKRRYFIPPGFDYKAVNYLVQGTCADIVKNRLVAVRDYLVSNNFVSRILLVVHDELILEIAHGEEWIVKFIKVIMEERQTDILLPVSVKRGNPSWAQADPVDVEAL